MFEIVGLEWTPARIRRLRTLYCRMTQTEFGYLIGFTSSYCKWTIIHWEDGRTKPSLKFQRGLDKAARKYGYRE
jgi:DNA-binding XRE family transcriptional regulator